MMYMSPTDRDYAIRTVLAEAGENSSPVSQAAVANVIKNRLSSGKFGGNVTSIVTAPYQFEPWLYAGKGSKTNDPTRFSQNSPAYQDAGRIVDAVFSQANAPDPTNGATHFISPDAQKALGRSTPTWAQGTPLATIGGQQYFAPQGGAPHPGMMKMDPAQMAAQQPSSIMALLAPLLQGQGGGQTQTGGATGANSGLTRGYSPNAIGQILFGQGGMRGAVQGGLNNMGMSNGILGSLFGGGGQQLPQNPTAGGAPQQPPNPAAGASPMAGQAQPMPGGMQQLGQQQPMPGGQPGQPGQLPMGGNGLGMHAPLASMQMPSVGPQGTGGAGSTSPLSTITAGLGAGSMPNMSGLGALGSMFGMF